jgi:hypothetical protein
MAAESPAATAGMLDPNGHGARVLTIMAAGRAAGAQF